MFRAISETVENSILILSKKLRQLFPETQSQHLQWQLLKYNTCRRYINFIVTRENRCYENIKNLYLGQCKPLCFQKNTEFHMYSRNNAIYNTQWCHNSEPARSRQRLFVLQDRVSQTGQSHCAVASEAELP